MEKTFFRSLKATEGINVSISPKGNYYIDTWNSITSAGSIIAYDRKGKQIREIHKFDQPVYDPDLHQRSEMVRITYIRWFVQYAGDNYLSAEF